MDYNIPLNNHSAKFIINYNTQTKIFKIQWGFFGINWENEMNKIAQLVALEGVLLNANLPYEPSYSENNRSFECSWQLHADQINTFAKNVNNIIKHYSDLTESQSTGMPDLLNRYCNDETPLPVNVYDRITAYSSALNDKELVCFTSQFPNLLKKVNLDEFKKINIDKIFDCLDKLNVEKLDLLENKCNIKIDICYISPHSYMSDYTFLVSMIGEFSGSEMLKYLEKHNPDMSQHANIIHAALKNKSPDAKLILDLISRGADIPNELRLNDIVSIFKSQELLSALNYKFDTWDNLTMTKWLYSELKRYRRNSDFTRMDMRIAFIREFKSKIDFNYKSAASDATLLELCIGTIVNSTESAKKMADILSKDSINLSIHKNILSLALSKEENIWILQMWLFKTVLVLILLIVILIYPV